MNLRKMLPAKPPAILIEFLEVARLIPPEPNFFNVERFLEQNKFRGYPRDEPRFTEYDLLSDNYFVLESKFKEAWTMIIKCSMLFDYEILVDKIFEGSIRAYNPYKYVQSRYYIQVNSFREFSERHKTIRSIAKNWELILSAQFPDGYEEISYYEEDTKLIIERVTLPLDIPIQPAFTMDGKLDYFTNPFNRALSEIDTRRLRICPICDYVFWAYQSNQKWCSGKCKRTGSKRKTLANPEDRARINAQRRENYQRNKKLNDLKENKNGSL